MMHEALHKALSGLAEGGPMADQAKVLFNALGYRSPRTLDVRDVREFVDTLNKSKSLTDRQRKLFGSWRSADIVFQVTGDEIRREIDGQLDFLQAFDKTRVNSFLFVAADLEDRSFSRTELAEMTRVVNRGFLMPVIVLFRHGASVTLAAVHRRAHKRDSGRDVLERVTLVKDIRATNPHRAHLQILGDLELPGLLKVGVDNFDKLHAEWERVLDIEKLNKSFYNELFEWFGRAVEEVCFPDDGAGDGSKERHVIRLITRLLFIWFMKEKKLIPEDLFEENFATNSLKNYRSDDSNYYRAILQNLFFATLNTEIRKRTFSKKTNTTHRDFSKYRYQDLLANPADFVKKLKGVPFINGGLFDCLDDFSSAGSGGRRIDAFTDNMKSQGSDLNVPARLFFDDDGLFPLFRRYKFTVEENTPLDQEVALDPELLGRTFENLLAAYNPETREPARRVTGSYYTPRRVVNYMVQEALADALVVKVKPMDGDCSFLRDRLEYLLDHSDAMADAEELFNEAEKCMLVGAIAELRTLDPAVGSGAFPMAMLQTLTMALRRLDPDNSVWETIQKKRAQTRAAAAFDAEDRKQRDKALHEISRTFEKYRASDFGRKLYLIQNSIYGVDIQPIACQIAKLRVFISLTIDQETDPEAPNHGIKPLPNLETRIVAADALFSLRDETSSWLDDNDVESKRKQIAAVRERYLLSDSRSRKITCIREEEALRRELKNLLEEIWERWIAYHERRVEETAAKIGNEKARKKYREAEKLKIAQVGRKMNQLFADAQKVAEWDPYDQNTSAGWFDAKYMFGVQDGFDVVIGNPPYIRLSGNDGALAKRYSDAGYETFVRSGDIYQLFYERGCRMMKSRTGVLAYITSNSWLKAQSGRLLRRWLAENHTPLYLIEMGKDVFDAIVDTSILLIREGGTATNLSAVDMDRLDSTMFPPPEKSWGEARLDDEAPWRALSDTEWQILDKMNIKGTFLRDWKVSINNGIKTGCNSAFIIDDKIKHILITENPKSSEIIKPILQGRDIHRWNARWVGKWLIDTHNGYDDQSGHISPINICDYPNIKCHLDRFFPCLIKRKDQGQTPYNLRSCAYHEDFGKEKLLWMDMSPKGRFSYSNMEIYCSNTGFIMIGESIKYLSSILNSRLITWFMMNTARTTGMGLLRWERFSVEGIPVPHISLSEQRSFVMLMDRILSAKNSNPDTDIKNLEAEIDRLVYQLYALTAEEIAMIEKIVRS